LHPVTIKKKAAPDAAAKKERLLMWRLVMAKLLRRFDLVDLFDDYQGNYRTLTRGL